MDYVKAFIIGGLICAVVQILLDRTKLMPGRVMVLLVCAGAVSAGYTSPFRNLPVREPVCRCWDLEMYSGRG